MSPLSLPKRLGFLIAIAMAVVCGSKTVHAGVITGSSFSDKALISCADAPAETPDGHVLKEAQRGGLQGVPVSSTGGSHTIGMATGFLWLVDVSVSGRSLIVDQSIPDDPFLGGLPKPA